MNEKEMNKVQELKSRTMTEKIYNQLKDFYEPDSITLSRDFYETLEYENRELKEENQDLFKVLKAAWLLLKRCKKKERKNARKKRERMNVTKIKEKIKEDKKK